MNTIILKLIMAILVLSPLVFSNATYASNSLEIVTYNKALKQAIRLYKNNEFEQALPQLELFARRGDKMSQYIVGTMYLNAQGTKQDLLKSYAWLSVANEQKSEVWEKPLIMLQEKLPKDYLVNLISEGDKYLELYGAKSQRLKCKNVRELGSKKPTYRCKKMEVKNGHYYVDDEQSLALID